MAAKKRLLPELRWEKALFVRFIAKTKDMSDTRSFLHKCTLAILASAMPGLSKPRTSAKSLSRNPPGKNDTTAGGMGDEESSPVPIIIGIGGGIEEPRN